MAKSFLGKALKVTFGIAAVAGAAAAAGIAYGLKKWSEDDDSKEIKITTGCGNGMHITKTEDGKYLVNTKYDWTTDPEAFDDGENEHGGIVIDISGDKCCCKNADEASDAAEEEEKTEDEPCDCGCEEHSHEAEEAPEEDTEE